MDMKSYLHHFLYIVTSFNYIYRNHAVMSVISSFSTNIYTNSVAKLCTYVCKEGFYEIISQILYRIFYAIKAMILFEMYHRAPETICCFVYYRKVLGYCKVITEMNGSTSGN